MGASLVDAKHEGTREGQVGDVIHGTNERTRQYAAKGDHVSVPRLLKCW